MISPEAIKLWENISRNHNDECISTTNIDPVVLKRIVYNRTVPNDRNVYCYLRCIYEKLDFLLPNGEFDEDKIVNTATYLTHEVSKKYSNKPLRIHVFDALIFARKEWSSVSAITIKNCFEKSGFPTAENKGLQHPVDAEALLSNEEYCDKIVVNATITPTFRDFVNVDDHGREYCFGLLSTTTRWEVIMTVMRELMKAVMDI
ncbi:hypothetical protein FQA39_LY12360 [Lamprigera yunnana]|nr:hypothetical protein FQA39_LY12360 [Lamprigera yunnana]